MSIDSFWGNIFKRQLDIDNVKALRSCPAFKDFPVVDIVKIANILHLRRFYKNEFIFRENEPGESMYIVKSGKVKIYSTYNDQEQNLALLDPGSFFGEVSLIDESARSANAIANEETHLLVFFRSDLMTLIDRDPRLSSFILLQLSTLIGERLRVNNSELTTLKYGQ